MLCACPNAVVPFSHIRAPASPATSHLSRSFSSHKHKRTPSAEDPSPIAARSLAPACRLCRGHLRRPHLQCCAEGTCDAAVARCALERGLSGGGRAWGQAGEAEEARGAEEAAKVGNGVEASPASSRHITVTYCYRCHPELLVQGFMGRRRRGGGLAHCWLAPPGTAIARIVGRRGGGPAGAEGAPLKRP